MLERALFPTDFSKPSEKIAEHIHDLRRMGIKEVTIMHVIDLNKLIPPSAGIDLPTILSDYEKDVKENLKRVASIIENQGFRVNIAPIVEGDPVLRVIEYAKENFDVIILGSHGKGIVSEILLGSVSEGIVRRSPIPVFVVKFKIVDETLFDRIFDRVLYAYDFSEDSKKLKDYVKFFSKKEVIIVHVVEKGEELSEDKIKELEDLKAELERNAKVEILIEGGVPYKEILKVAEEKEVTLITLAGKGESMILGIGGTTDNIVRRAKIPVFVYKSKNI